MEKVNILLIESHYRSRSWFEAIKDLGNLYIMSTMPEEKKIFKSQGVNDRIILDLHEPKIASINLNDAKKYIIKLEKKLEINVIDLALMDRTIKLKNYDYIIKYSYFVSKKIETFVLNNNINIVFMESTWLHEILTCKICEHYSISVFNIQISKILSNRFFFFKGYLNQKFYKRCCSNVGLKSAIENISNPGSIDKPQYFDKLSKRNKITFSKFKVLYDIIRLSIFGYNNKNIQQNWLKSLILKVLSIGKASFLMKTKFFCNANKITNLKYILVTLHVQPEASIDVLGARFSDQIGFVQDIARSTPSSHFVVVKEHPHAIGGRKSGFYKKIKSSPNVILANPYEDSRALIKKADLVLSNTGTSSLEAALFGVPSSVASKMYFSEILSTPSFNPCIDSIGDLIEKGEQWKCKFDKNEAINSLLEIEKHSFEGNLWEFKIDPSVLSKKNIKNLKKAFTEVIGTVDL